VSIAVAVGLLTCAVVASISVGALPTSLAQIHHALFSPSDTEADQWIRSWRIPRTLLGLVVGAALGIAGTLIQGHTRNPLADPGVLGLTGGAAFFVALSIFACGMTSPSQYVWFALAGAFVTALGVYIIATLGGNRSVSPLSFALVGTAISLSLQAITNALIMTDLSTLDTFRFWVVGSVAGRDIGVFLQVAPFLVVGFLLALLNGPALNNLNLGDDLARGLGSNIVLSRVIGLIAICLLSGAATAACGPISFLGLAVPHIARKIVGYDYRWLVPFSGLLGALLLVSADVLGRMMLKPAELHVGIILVLIGAPFFIVIVRKNRLTIA
ncbi:MAG: FecCD family ABC transporter permease, partial [Mycobacteriaceae bacterium]